MFSVLSPDHINAILYSCISKLSKVAFQVANPLPRLSEWEVWWLLVTSCGGSTICPSATNGGGSWTWKSQSSTHSVFYKTLVTPPTVSMRCFHSHYIFFKSFFIPQILPLSLSIAICFHQVRQSIWEWQFILVENNHYHQMVAEVVSTA